MGGVLGGRYMRPKHNAVEISHIENTDRSMKKDCNRFDCCYYIF
jgi:hypothetical protein